MSIKRILVHIGHHEERGRARLEAGLALARRLDAELLGLFIVEPSVIPAQVEGRGASLAYISETIAHLREKAAVMEAEFRRRCGPENIRWRWISAEGETLDILTAYSFYADVTLVGQQRASGLDDAISLHRSDYLPLQSAGPVVIMPRQGGTDLAARNVMVAWKPELSCARALHNALPLLTRAETVTVLMIDPLRASETPDISVTDFFTAHGIAARLETRTCRTLEHIGEVILAAAKESGSDLLVMGAHGHSRIAEMIFGGATRDVLGKMHLPVLMSH